MTHHYEDMPPKCVAQKLTQAHKYAYNSLIGQQCASHTNSRQSLDTPTLQIKVHRAVKTRTVAVYKLKWRMKQPGQLQGPHHQWHIRCWSGVWSGITLRRASVQLSKPSDATYSARPVGQPGYGRRLPQLGQLTIGEELLGNHNNNKQPRLLKCL